MRYALNKTGKTQFTLWNWLFTMTIWADTALRRHRPTYRNSVISKYVFAVQAMFWVFYVKNKHDPHLE